MSDIATYNANEARAVRDLQDSGILQLFRSDAFEIGGFPVRIEVLPQIRVLLTALHPRKAASFQAELRGIDGPVLDELAKAMAVLVEMQLSLFPEKAVAMPVSALLSDYLIARKLLALPRPARILDIGPGCGLLPLFLARHPAVRRYDQIEVTQSLYILQSHVNRACYGAAAADLAMAGAPQPDGFATMNERLKAETEPRVSFGREERCVHFPWWRIDTAFASEYDVVMMNENLCEMPAASAEFYLRNVRRVLARDGFLLILGIGQTQPGAGGQELDQRLKVLTSLGFRPLIANQSYQHGGPLAAPNLVLVPEGHPRYAEAAEDCFTLAFDESDPMVRAMYGLDRPTGPALELPALIAELKRRVDALRAGDRRAR